MEKYNIPGVEIFSKGTWNGDEYTMDDLQEMVTAHNEAKTGINPHVKLGHDKKQSLLQKDGLPAAGYVDKLYIKGEKLMADLVDVPKKVYQLVTAGAYKKVSAEIFWNLKVNNKIYKRALGAVALLGADMPGVGNLNDILAMYSKSEFDELKVYEAIEFNNQTFPRKEMTMSKTEAEIKLELELKQAKEAADLKEQQLKEFTAKQEESAKEIETLKKFKADAEKRENELKAQAEKAELEKFVTELESEKLIAPSMKTFVTELLGPEKKEYKIKKDEKEETVTKQALLKEVLKLHKASLDVNFDESSEEGEKKNYKADEKEQEEKVRKYMAEHKCSYGQAAKAILNEQAKKSKE